MTPHSTPVKLLLLSLTPLILAVQPALGRPACTVTEITHSMIGQSLNPTLDGNSIAFESSADLTGHNADHNREIFLFNGSTITQITNSTSGNSFVPSIDRGSIAFSSNSDLTGESPGGVFQIFLFDGSTITQITNSGSSFGDYLDRGNIAFSSGGDFTGGNPEGNTEVFLASCRLSVLDIPTAGLLALAVLASLLTVAALTALRPVSL